MDWGLFDRNAGENRFLREEIVYSSTVSNTKQVYYYINRSKQILKLHL